MVNEDLRNTIKDNSKLLNIIRCFHTVDRTLLCELMGLSWPTIQKMTDVLKKSGILLNSSKTDNQDKKANDKKEEFTINTGIGYYIGISVGGSQIKISMIDLNFNIVKQNQFIDGFVHKFKFCENADFDYTLSDNSSKYGYIYTNTPTSFLNLQRMVNFILDEIIRIDFDIKNDFNLLGIGFAFTGAVINTSKEIIKSFSLECFNNLPIKYDSFIYPEKLAYFTTHNINIAFDNIAKAAIVSEKYSLYNSENPNNIYKDRKNVGCIYLGSGIGSSFVLNNTLYRGTSNFSELGHIDVIDPIDLVAKIENSNQIGQCTCGGNNCLEHKIRTVVFDMDVNDFKKYTASQLRERFFEMKDCEIRLQILAFYINQAIKTTTNLLNLDLVILTGKLTQFMDDLEKYLYSEKSNNPISYVNSNCSLLTSTYGALAPSIGAAILVSYTNTNDSIVWY